jgi:hypothetical protein
MVDLPSSWIVVDDSIVSRPIEARDTIRESVQRLSASRLTSAQTTLVTVPVRQRRTFRGGKIFPTSLVAPERPGANFSRAGDGELRPLSRRRTEGEVLGLLRRLRAGFFWRPLNKNDGHQNSYVPLIENSPAFFEYQSDSRCILRVQPYQLVSAGQPCIDFQVIIIPLQTL